MVILKILTLLVIMNSRRSSQPVDLAFGMHAEIKFRNL